PHVLRHNLWSSRRQPHVKTVTNWRPKPIGALLAVVVFEFIVSQSQQLALGASLLLFLRVVAVGLTIGYVAGRAVGAILYRRWLPEFLHNLMALSTVLFVFSISNVLAPEAGLLAVTVMGMVMANLPNIRISEIMNFKENLTIVLISGLFIVLAARLNLEELLDLGFVSLGLVLVIQLVARPLAVMVSTLGSSLSWRERALLAWIAPRGIVAAAIAALFAFRLAEAGLPNAEELVPLTFMVIICTVVFQSGTARFLATLLRVAEPAPRGFLIIGANLVARAVGKVLNDLGFQVTLTDSSWENISAARMDGLNTFFGNPISAYADRNLYLVGLGNVLALSPQRELNVASSMRFRHEFGREHVFVLLARTDEKVSEKHQVAEEHQGQVLFSRQMTYAKLASMLSRGVELKKTKLTDNFTYDDYLQQDKNGVPMFAVTPKGQIVVRVVDRPFNPEAGWIVVGVSDRQSVVEKAAEKNQEKRIEKAEKAEKAEKREKKE
ncbi:MAG: cation:proton antiporter, partial [Gammaproteobacteria bacterium]